jgi:formylmethanofuran dehydrogenase subunit B
MNYEVDFTYDVPEYGTIEIALEDGLTPEEVDAAIYLEVKNFVDLENGVNMQINTTKEVLN